MQTTEQSQIDSGTLKRARARALVDFWQNNEAYKFYVPNGKAEEFIAAVGRDDTFISLFSAANGVGKTAVGANMLANIFWESPTEWFNYPLYKNFPYNKRGRIVSDHTTIKTTLIPELEKWFPKGRYKTDNMGKNYPYIWKTDTGFEFDLMTYDQSDKEFESANLGWIWFDEPPPESIYKASVARLRNGGVMFITATPLTGSAWMYDQIMTKPEAGQRQVIEADVWSNSISKGIRGRLTDRDIDRMIAEYSEEDKQARIFGKFQHLTGLVFKNFNRKIHVIKPFEITKQDFVVVERLDTHPRNPDACLWVAVDKNNTKFVVDELYIKATTQELASSIKQKAFPFRLLDRKIDPSAFIEDQHTGKSLAGLLRSLGLDYLPASKRRAMTIERIRNALDYREAGDMQQGTQLIKRPELYVFNTCVRTIWEFEHWQYHEYSGKAEEYRGKSEKPQDKDDHMMESLGRALIDEPQFQIYKPEYFQQGSVEGQVLTLDPYN